jgi:hypothetical protein
MRFLSSRGALVWASIGVLAYACTGPDRNFIDTSGNAGEGGEGLTGTGGAAGSSSGKGGASGRGGSSGASSGTAGTDPCGAGGEGGEPEPPPPPGRPGTALVAGGEYMRSTNYQLFVITGNGSLPVTSTSTNYRLRGGIVGTTQP